MGADIQIRHRLRPTPCRIEGKSAGKAEHIQNITPFREQFHPRPVVALIEEKPGLLAMQDRRFEANPVLRKHHRLFAHLTAEPLGDPEVPRTLRHIPAHPQHEMIGGKYLTEHTLDFLPHRQPTRRIDFHHQSPGVFVRDDSGKSFTLAIDQACAIRARLQDIAFPSC